MAETGLIIFPSIVFGLIIGLYELFAIHADESFRGSHWFGHGLHAALFAIVGVFATMNVDYVLGLIPSLQNIAILGNALYLRLAIGFVVLIKVYTSSAVVKGAMGRGMHEKWYHVLIVAGLIVGAPYIYPFIEPMFPAFLK